MKELPERYSGNKMLKPKEIDKNVYELAIERIEESYRRFDTVGVSFSGGKDSTTVLNLVLEVATRKKRLPLEVLFYDEEAIPPDTIDYVRRIYNRPDIKMRWYCIPIKHRNACARSQPFWYTWNKDKKDLWVLPLPPEGLTELKNYTDGKYGWGHMMDLDTLVWPVEDYGTVGQLMGIRAQESMTRLRAVIRRETNNYIIKSHPEHTPFPQNDNVWKVYPIYDWKTEDVWTAPRKFGWDYNITYDLFDKIGLTPLQQRLSAPYGEEPLQRFATYKQCWPEMWEKLIKRVPGANTAAIYSKTKLYGFGGVQQKPEDMTWHDFIKYIVEKWDPKVRKTVAGRVKTEINIHYSKTTDPIPDKDPHPLSGISWKHLVMLASRGDFKQRRQAGIKVMVEDKELYHAEQRASGRSSLMGGTRFIKGK